METKTKCCNKTGNAGFSKEKEMVKEQMSEKCMTDKCETKPEHECESKKKCDDMTDSGHKP